MSLEACAELVRRGDPDRFAAVLAAPKAARAVLLPIYAFNIEVSRAPWLTEEPTIAEMRLQWWRDALDEIGHGGAVRRHDVTTPLAVVLDAEGASLLDRLVAARRWDIYSDAFEDRAHFDSYLDNTGGGLMWVSARALGVSFPEAALRDVGWAAGLAAWFRAIPDLEARGRKPLVDGTAEAVSGLADEALDRMARSRGARAHPATLSAWPAGPILRQARAAPRRVADGTIGLSEFARRARLARMGLTGRCPG